MRSKRLFKVLKYTLPFSFDSNIKFVIQFAIILIYLYSLYNHYEYEFYFLIYLYLSKLTHKIIYLELYIGIFSIVATIFCAVDQKQYLKQIVTLVRKNIITGQNDRYHLDEVILYYKIALGALIFLGLNIYNLAMLKIEDLAFYKLMLYLGLYIPHALMANAMHFYCGNVILLQMMCSQINDKLKMLYLLGKSKAESKQSMCWSNRDNILIKIDLIHIDLKLHEHIGTRICQTIKNYLLPKKFFKPNKMKLEVPFSVNMKSLFEEDLAGILHNFDIFQIMSKHLNKLFQIQMLLLFLHHFMVCLVCAHALLKMVQQWSFILLPDDENSIRINAQVFLFLVFNDFACLFLIGTTHKNEVILLTLALDTNNLDSISYIRLIKLEKYC